jgi:4'-phosphopantetheinyl transferase
MVDNRREWLPAPARLVLRPDEVRLVRARLAVGEAALASLARTLSPDELIRAGRFHLEADRDCYVAGRGILRHLLAGALGVEPRGIVFDYGPHGKPRLAVRHEEPRLLFSKSSSRDLALYAFTLDREVGVDVEYRGEAPSGACIGSTSLPSCVQGVFASLSGGGARDFFYDWWTRIEALGKLGGEGLPGALEAPIARFGAGEVFDCPPDPMYAAACAVEGGRASVVKSSLDPADLFRG